MTMKYHFKIHHGESGKFWAECVEMPGCLTQAGTEKGLRKNMEEVLNLYLDEPSDSKMAFPLPKAMRVGAGIVEVQVMPEIALAVRIRNARLMHGYTQMQAAKKLGMKNVFSYQRLEKRPKPNFTILAKIKTLFPEISLDEVFSVE